MQPKFDAVDRHPNVPPFSFFQSAEGKKIIENGWKAAGIDKAITQARDGEAALASIMDPFKNLKL